MNVSDLWFFGIHLLLLIVFAILQMPYWLAAVGVLLISKQLGRIASALKGI